MSLLAMALAVVAGAAANAAEAPQAGRAAWWWDEGWWTAGRLPEVRNYPVETSETSYRSGDVEVPVFIARPKGQDKLHAVLWVHGRRGLDELAKLHVVRLAARGLIVYAPDLYTGRFIAPMPIEHDYVLEEDLSKGLDALLKRADIQGNRVCVVSITRGGYYALKLAVAKQRQGKDLACYVGYYPHLQDPNAPEPLQVYQYAPEVDRLEIPTLILVGEEEQYHRKRVIESSVDTLRLKRRAVQLVVYPGVGRGFDFRPENVRTFADDLATKDAMQRVAAFVRRHLAP